MSGCFYLALQYIRYHKGRALLLLICLTIICLIFKTNALCLDSNASLTLDIHRIKHLFIHLTF